MDEVADKPLCEFPKDRPLTLADLLAVGDCRIEAPKGGLTFSAQSEIRDKHGHKLDGDRDPHGVNGCDHRDTPEWKAEHPRGKPKEKKESHMSESIQKPAEAPHAEQPAPAPAPATTETVGVDAAVAQVKSLVPADASPALMIGGAAVLAVIGGALKFGPSFMKSRAEAAERQHELELKKLELEENRGQKDDEGHQKCGVERAALEARVSAIESKIDAVGRKVEKAVSSVPQFDEDFNPEAIEKRLVKLEKAAKKPAPKKR